ncbi:serine hydrolase FSH [Whalleya microplaca]|nr:serine hydrolase FSH [Whalleya microplaca]
MATNGQPASGKPAQAKAAASAPEGGREIKILFLHGYTQNGSSFNSKTKALTKQFKKVIPTPIKLVFADAPHKLRPSQIPGFTPAPDAEPTDEEIDTSLAWFRMDGATKLYRGFEAGMDSIAAAIASAGGVDGVVGFSQGAAVAAFVAAALEQPSRTPPADAPSVSAEGEKADWGWVERLRAANGHRALGFAVSYSGFFAPMASLAWLYEPKIHTPTLHFCGSLDTIVEEARSQGLADRCVDPTIVIHPGGHYIPISKDWNRAFVSWVAERCKEIDAAAAAESKESL